MNEWIKIKDTYHQIVVNDWNIKVSFVQLKVCSGQISSAAIFIIVYSWWWRINDGIIYYRVKFVIVAVVVEAKHSFSFLIILILFLVVFIFFNFVLKENNADDDDDDRNEMQKRNKNLNIMKNRRDYLTVSPFLMMMMMI